MSSLSMWAYGSYDRFPDSDVTFAGAFAGTETITATLGSLYTDHATGSLSLRVQMVAAMTAAGATAPFVRMLENRKWEIGHLGAAFDITWTDILVRQMFGFTQGNLTGASSYIAASPSPYQWMPGRRDSPRLAPLGVTGAETPDSLATAAPGGRVVVSERVVSDFVNALEFTHIDKTRYWTTDDGLEGEYKLFHTTVLRKGWKFFVFRNIPSDETSTTEVTLSLGSGLGPYILNPHKPGFGAIPLRREFPDVERSMGLTMHIAKSVEYEA